MKINYLPIKRVIKHYRINQRLKRCRFSNKIAFFTVCLNVTFTNNWQNLFVLLSVCFFPVKKYKDHIQRVTTQQ